VGSGNTALELCQECPAALVGYLATRKAASVPLAVSQREAIDKSGDQVS